MSDPFKMSSISPISTPSSPPLPLKAHIHLHTGNEPAFLSYVGLHALPREEKSRVMVAISFSHNLSPLSPSLPPSTGCFLARPPAHRHTRVPSFISRKTAALNAPLSTRPFTPPSLPPSLPPLLLPQAATMCPSSPTTTVSTGLRHHPIKLTRWSLSLPSFLPPSLPPSS